MNEVDSKYRLVIVATKRAKQLKKGARPRVHMPGAKETKVAIREVEEGLAEYEVLEEPKKERRRANDEHEPQ